jgi:aromatic ring-opening dioxygenase catalytic subunit (LigB family)
LPALPKVAELLSAAGMPWRCDNLRGFDHGVLIPLKVAFPPADPPIVQVSLMASMNPAEHIRLGQAPAPLRDEGVLIVGSGMTYHNMQMFIANRDAKSHAPDAGSQGFDDWLEEVSPERYPTACRRPDRLG